MMIGFFRSHPLEAITLTMIGSLDDGQYQTVKIGVIS
jgi:hypothetical protein